MLFKKKPVAPPERPTVTLGTYRADTRTLPFRLGPRGVRCHGVLSGKSGFGKSFLLQAYCPQLLDQHEAFSLVDPHADAARAILHYALRRGFFASPEAFSRLWYIRWSRRDFCIPFNVLVQPRFDAYTLAGHIHEAFIRAFPAADGSTPLFSSILLPALVVLIENHLPITMLLPLLTDRSFRLSLLAHVDDPAIHAFFERFESWGKGATIESTARRLHLLTFNPVLRYSLGQRQNRLDFRAIQDEGISVLHDLGGLDDETRRLLMCLLQVGYEAAALSREELPASERTPHHLIVDEAASVAATSPEGFAHMLEQTRKFNLFLLLAFQSRQQLPQALQVAAGNVGLDIAFRQTEADAKALAHHYTDPSRLAVADGSPQTGAATAQLHQETNLLLERLGRQEARVRTGDRVATITTLAVPALGNDDGQLADLIDEYARRLATPAAQARREAETLRTAQDMEKETTRGYATVAEKL